MVSLCLIGCTYFSNNEGEGMSGFPPVMKGYVTIFDKQYKMNDGGYEWERKKGLSGQVVQSDHASPFDMASNIEPIYVSPEEKINITIDGQPNISVYFVNSMGREKEVEVKSWEIIAPSEKGQYIYEVVAEWSNGPDPDKWTRGKVSYVFVVYVE